MGDEGCCLGKEAQETPCFGFFSQTVSIFCLEIIMFEIHNHFLERGPFLTSIPGFPSSLHETLFLPCAAQKPQEEDPRCHQQRLPVCSQKKGPSWMLDFSSQSLLLGVGYLSVIVTNK